MAVWNRRVQGACSRDRRAKNRSEIGSNRLICGTRIAGPARENIFYLSVDVMGQRLRNTRHERFAREVAALTPYGTAYREAGFGGDPRWHPFNASKLANKPAVKARIEELRAEFEHMSAIHVDYVRHQLLRTIEADMRDLYESDPSDPTGKRRRLRAISELPRHLTGAITKLKISPETGEPVEIVLGDKNAAAATLLRSLPGGSVERHELSLEELIVQSMKPAPAESAPAAPLTAIEKRAEANVSETKDLPRADPLPVRRF